MNCCIERKRARDEARRASDGSKERDAAASPKPSADGAGKKSWESWSDSEEEFFECLTEQGEMEALSTGEEKGGRRGKAEGRLHRHQDMTLLNSDEPLYVPVTQVRTWSSNVKVDPHMYWVVLPLYIDVLLGAKECIPLHGKLRVE